MVGRLARSVVNKVARGTILPRRRVFFVVFESHAPSHTTWQGVVGALLFLVLFKVYCVANYKYTIYTYLLREGGITVGQVVQNNRVVKRWLVCVEYK